LGRIDRSDVVSNSTEESQELILENAPWVALARLDDVKVGFGRSLLASNCNVSIAVNMILKEEPA
jgi:hypothetical protein